MYTWRVIFCLTCMRAIATIELVDSMKYKLRNSSRGTVKIFFFSWWFSWQCLRSLRLYTCISSVIFGCVCKLLSGLSVYFLSCSAVCRKSFKKPTFHVSITVEVCRAGALIRRRVFVQACWLGVWNNEL